jgi:hypothetical protein
MNFGRSPAGYLSLPREKRERYEELLRKIGALSRLFSQSETPYLDSRVSENIYCEVFEAENKGRDDSAVDAVIGASGMGIKTFVGTGAQKVAEFNKDLLSFARLPPLEKVRKVAELRNERLEFAKRKYGLSLMYYHCIRRSPGIMSICEYPMDSIDLERIRISKESPKSISFTDGKGIYTFNFSKSVLLKSFPETSPLATIRVSISNDPFTLVGASHAVPIRPMLQKVVLPLYSRTLSRGAFVPERSGLNQWNAGGRARDPDEVYVPVPIRIHRDNPGFFPGRDTKFDLLLPDGTEISAKICQENGKALMSDPNADLGKWLLRKVLRLQPRKLVTYELLARLGIDSVEVSKLSRSKYAIDFVSSEASEE